MPSSNTPSDLKTVIIRALDAACTNASDENSNDCLSRSFANIKELHASFVPMCHVGNSDVDPFGKQRHRSGTSAVFFHFPSLNSLIFKGARCGGECGEAGTTRGNIA